MYNRYWCSNTNSQIIENINASQFETLIKTQDGIILDVRTSQEFYSGHISEATNLDYSGYGVSCLGASDGQINVTANGGVPAYNYIWSFQGDIVEEWEGSTEQINLLPGAYTITSVDQNGCDDTVNIELTEPLTGITFSAEAVDQNGVQITCDGANDGEINTTADGGVPPYTYTWTYEGDPIPETNNASNLTGFQPGE